MIAPSFSLPDQDGNWHSLSDYIGKWLVLYFYPKDDTSGCTKEACNFRDNYKEFEEKGVEVVGISKDGITSHQKFASKYDLNFTLLSDPDHKVIEEYKSWGKKKFMGKEYSGTLRNTFLINPDGNVVKEYLGVDPAKHTQEILHDLDRLIAGH